jgi:hypothetical protein
MGSQDFQVERYKEDATHGKQFLLILKSYGSLFSTFPILSQPGVNYDGDNSKASSHFPWARDSIEHLPASFHHLLSYIALE